MKKIIVLFIIIIGLFFTGLLQNCSTCTGEYYMVENTLIVEPLNEFIDSNEIRFQYAAGLECICMIEKNPNFLIESAYAKLHCDRINMTKIDSTKTEFRISKDFVFDGDTIEANSNLYTNSIIKDYLGIPNSMEAYFQTILFSMEFYSDSLNLTFEADNYTFYFKWVSTDGKVFEKSLTEYVDLKY